MVKIYLKQAWNMLKENPLISWLSIIGTVLAIAVPAYWVMKEQPAEALHYE